MKSEILDGSRVALIGTTGTYSSWALQDWNMVVAILVGVATGVFVLLKTVKLLYNWYWEHKIRMGQFHQLQSQQELFDGDPD